ncbi:MAG: P-loop NTPase [Beijerinckiaceae bacterium]
MPKIISTQSRRGGTGKSSVTANLAVQLALRGRRVAVVDGDLRSPGVHFLFQIDPQDLKLTLNDYLGGRCRIEDASVDVTAAVFDGKGKAVAAPQDHDDFGLVQSNIMNVIDSNKLGSSGFCVGYFRVFS